MGRQKGKQQRTKGNVTPSSSAQSAKLLSKENEISGLSALPTGGGNFPELDNLDAIRDSKFRIVLKKLSKRDGTTKLKALSEFVELCNNTEQHEVLSVLPYWPRIYGRLFEDLDRRVRENAQKAMGALVVVAGKNLAPHLKGFMGYWFLSQCDPYLPCATEAASSLTRAFRNEKKLEAYLFCRKEILSLIKGYLFRPSHQLGKGSESEENNNHRILACSIEALALYINTVGKEKPETEEITEIFENPKFWKFQRHRYPPIRGSFYSVFEPLCVVFPHVLEQHLTAACRSIFHRLDEDNINVCKPLYGAAVAIACTFDAWHTSVDINRGVVPSICSALRSGCYGLATAVLPTLLPILNRFPVSIGMPAVFTKVMEAMHMCMSHDQIRLYNHSLKLARTTFIELLQLSVKQALCENTGQEKHANLAHFVVNENIIPQIQKCFKQKPSKSNSNFYRLIARAIRSWTQKLCESQDVVLDELCSCFWTAVGNLFQEYFKDLDLPALHEVLSFLHEVLHYQAVVNEPCTVRFSSDQGKADDNDHNVKEMENTKQDLTVFCGIQQNINKIFSEKVFKHPFGDSKQMLEAYREILKSFANPQLFAMIQCDEGLTDTGNNKEQTICYFNNVLVPNIAKIAEKADGLTDRDMPVILSDIMFYTLCQCGLLNEMPEPLRQFCDAGTDEMKYTVCLQLLLRLTSNTVACNNHVWMRSIADDQTSHAWKFMETVIHNVNSCLHSGDEAQPDAPLSEDGWSLLKNVLTSSFTSTDNEEVFFCSETGFNVILSNLMDGLKALERSCSGTVSFNSSVQNISSLMLSCVPRGFASMRLQPSEGNIWLVLATSLLESYCMVSESQKSLALLSSVFEHVVNKLLPRGEVSISDVNLCIEAQMSWVKENLILNPREDIEICVGKVKGIVGSLVPILTFHGAILKPVLDNILPDALEWDQVRAFCTEKWMNFDSVVCSKQLPNTLSTGTYCLAPVGKSPDVHKYTSTVHACNELVRFVSKLDSPLEMKSVGEFGKITQLCEEYMVVGVLNGVMETPLFGDMGSIFCSDFQAYMLKKSLILGGIWPHCIQAFSTHFDRNHCERIVDEISQEIRSSQLGVPPLQTILAVWHLLSGDKISCLAIVILEHLTSVAFPDISVSDIYKFSLGVTILSQQSHEKHTEILKKYFELILTWRTTNDNDKFLFDHDLNAAAQELILFNSDMAHLFSVLIKEASIELIESQWDMICCSLVSWLENICNALKHTSTASVLILRMLSSVCKIVSEIDDFMTSPALKDDPTVPFNLSEEWAEFFSCAVFSSLIQIFLHLCVNTERLVPSSVFESISIGLRNVRTKDITSAAAHLKPQLSAGSLLPNEVQTLLSHLCPLLYPKYMDCEQKSLVQITAFNLLLALLPAVKSSESFSHPVPIHAVAEKAQQDIQALFLPSTSETSKAGPRSVSSDSDDGSIPDPDEEDSFATFQSSIDKNVTSVMAYLLSWKLLLKLTKYITSDHKSKYVDGLMKTMSPSLTNDLLPKLFRLMVGKQSHFKSEPALIEYRRIGKQEVEHVASSVYKDFLVELPAASRMWYNDLPKVMCSRVDKFTSEYVTPTLIEDEFEAIYSTRHQQATEGMEIIARLSAREVYATYKLNEAEMEITVCLAPNHPLGPITVNTEKRAGVVIGQWRYWILQITTFLQYQNGGIIDGLLLWKEKVDKRFEGLEECMICFSIVHGSNQSLPKLKCKTCKKKYHAECLYKWFDTSNNSTCPLCRTPMIFR